MNLAAAAVTTAPKPGLAWRGAFSFPAALAASLVALAVLTVRGRFNDPDLWWHLKTGEVIWAQRTIPRTDLFSFTTSHDPWVAHEWLSQLGIYGCWKAGGYPGLMLWLCALTATLLILSYLLCWLYSGHATVALPGALVAWFFATIGLAIRPQLVGYVWLACELLLLELGRLRDRRWLFLLPALFAVWVNCHGSFFLGLMVLAVSGSCSLADVRAGLPVSRPQEPARRKVFLWACALSAVAVFVNPVGPPLLTYPLKTVFDPRMQLQAVSEWQGLAFDDARAFGLLGVAGTILVVALVRRSRLYLEECLRLGMVFGMAVLHQRLLFAFGIVAAPVLCRLLADLWPRPGPARRGLNAFLMLTSLAIAILAFPGTGELAAQVDRGNPVRAVDFIRRSGLSGRMLNDYVYGGYLIWALPEQKVFIDGRGDVYAWSGVLAEYGDWATLRADPTVLPGKYGIDFCLMSRAAPVARVLPYLPGWRELYSDSLSVIFVRSGGQPGTP